MELQEGFDSSTFTYLPPVATPMSVHMEWQEVLDSSTFTYLPPVATPLMSVDMELQEDFDPSAFTSLPPVATTLPAPPASFLPDVITSPTHSTHVSPPPKPITHVTPSSNGIIVRILKDGIASIFLKYQLPATIVGNVFTLISSKPGHFESTGVIMLGLLSLSFLAFIAGKVVRHERPLIAAVAELIGISLSAAALIYPMSVLLGGSILCYVPLIIGVVVAGMYIYRLATTSGGGDTDGAPVQVEIEELV